MNTLTIHTDGGSRGNPGHAAAGVVICHGEEVLHQFSSYLGIKTNNQAEYQAVILALEYLIDHKSDFSSFESVNFVLDSELVVRQINGQYKVKHPDMIPLFTQVKTNLSKLGLPYTFSHVKRHLNHHADQLLNDELDLQTK